MRLPVGARFGRYEIVALLGEGGMGSVYRAHDPTLRRDVALKVVRTEASDVAPAQAARLVREARAAAAMKHASTVAVYEVGEVDGVPFIAMELVEGVSLRARTKSASLAEKLRWLLDLADALAAAHRVGIVHRDVKPDNVFVTPAGAVRLLDFGLARGVERDDPDSFRTRDGTIVGTPAYMPPEQAMGATADARSDQFAWGVTAYEVLAGAHPQPSGERGWRRDSTSPEPLRTHAPEVPEGIAAIVHRAMRLRADLRFDSMDELCAAMRDAMGATQTLRDGAPTLDAAHTTAGSEIEPRRARARSWTWPVIALAATACGFGAWAALRARARTASTSAPSTITSASTSTDAQRPATVTTWMLYVGAPSKTVPDATPEHIAGLLDCYRGAIERDRDAAGTVSFFLTTNTDETVTQLEDFDDLYSLQQEQFPDRRFHACVAHTMRRWHVFLGDARPHAVIYTANLFDPRTPPSDLHPAQSKYDGHWTISSGPFTGDVTLAQYGRRIVGQNADGDGFGCLDGVPQVMCVWAKGEESGFGAFFLAKNDLVGTYGLGESQTDRGLWHLAPVR